MYKYVCTKNSFYSSFLTMSDECCGFDVDEESVAVGFIPANVLERIPQLVLENLFGVLR